MTCIGLNSVCPGEIHTRMVEEILPKRGGDAKAGP
jgi:NAD(P)-dependent dehydrogenase (short-subunit alcohol dehydrogenase family)